jgi:hypothetical protein
MKTTLVLLLLSSLQALSGCASQLPPAPIPVATVCPPPPAPPAWMMVAPPTQTSTQRLRAAFSLSPETTSGK